MTEGVSRRGLLAGAVVAAASSVLAMPDRNAQRAPARSLRVAFLTDVHLDVHQHCVRGFVNALRKVEALDDKPDLIIQGGDIIMDGLMRDADSVRKQYQMASSILARHKSIPVEHVIGNHDVWAWQRTDAQQLATDDRFGKAWWLDWTGYNNTYRSFDKGGWHFILLDSIAWDHVGYRAQLDDAQRQWLQNDLASTPATTPICIVSHVPILSTAAMFFGRNEEHGYWNVSRTLMHIDARWLKDLLVKHPNVKTCLSGHIHMANRVDYNGVKHFGMGAVCGAWWRGKMQETPPQFGVVDFYADGNVHTTYVPC